MEKKYIHEKYGLKVLLFVGQLISTLLLYVLGIWLYTTLSAKPIIFFASCYLALVLAVATGWLILVLFRKIVDVFTVTLMSLCCAMIIILFAVFGPVFIDRSISYHIVFYATEHGTIRIDQMEQAFSHAIFSKRIDDAQAAGFITPNADGSFAPTMKAKLFTAIMVPLGKISHSLENYKSMTNAITYDR